MADEQKPKASKKSKSPEAKDEHTAKKAGGAAAKAAPPAEAPPAEALRVPKKSMKPAKLQKKNNPHLPRKLKKAQKKAAAAVIAKPTPS